MATTKMECCPRCGSPRVMCFRDNARARVITSCDVCGWDDSGKSSSIEVLHQQPTAAQPPIGEIWRQLFVAVLQGGCQDVKRAVEITDEAWYAMEARVLGTQDGEARPLP